MEPSPEGLSEYMAFIRGPLLVLFPRRFTKICRSFAKTKCPEAERDKNNPLLAAEAGSS
jgi:hypothetical protein